MASASILRSAPARYGLAVAAALAAVALRWALIPVIGSGTLYIALFPVLTIVALTCGTGPGLLCNALSILFIEYFIAEPAGDVQLTASLAVRSTIILLTTYYVGRIGDRLRAARARAEAETVAARTAEAALRRQVELIDPARAQVIMHEMQRVVRESGAAGPAPSIPAREWLRLVPPVAGAAVAATGALVLAGWATGLNFLKSVLPGLAAMKANTALCFVLAGTALALQERRTIRRACAGFICAVAGLTLAEYFTGSDFGIDQLMFRDPGDLHTIFSGRMVEATALGFVLASASLLLLDLRARLSRQVQEAAAVCTGVIGLVAVLGYCYGVEQLYRFAGYSSMALHTAASFVLLAAGLLLARRDGLAAVLAAPGPGAQLALRLLPVALLAPIAAGFICKLGLRQGFYGTGMDIASLALVMILIFSALVLWTARALNHADETRREADKQLRSQAEMIDQAGEALIVRELGGIIRSWNRGAERLYGWSAAEVLGQRTHVLFGLAAAAVREMEPVLERVGRWEGELAHTTRDGRRITVESRMTATQTEKGHVLVLESNRDISERKQAEAERERLLVEITDAQKQLAADLEATARLQKLGTLFLSAGNLESVLTEIVDAAIAISGADYGNIQFLDSRTAALRIMAQRGFPQWWVDFWNGEPADRGSCGAALECRERVIVEDIEQSPIFAGTRALEIQRRAGVRAVQSTPLVSRSGAILGMLSTHYRMPHRPDERTLTLLDLLSRHAADIIERAQTEEVLRRNEERFRIIASSTPDHLLVQDGDLRYTFVLNPQLGLTEQEMLGKTDYDILAREDAEKLAGIKRRVLETETSIHLEMQLASRDGQPQYFDGSYVPRFDAQGRVNGLLGYFRNVTESKLAQAEMAALAGQRELALDAAHLGWWHYDPITRMASWDDRYREIFGVTGNRRLNDEILAQIIHPEDLPGLWARVEAALDPVNPQPYAAEYRIRRPDGMERWIEAHGIATFEGTGSDRRATSLVGTVADITARKQAERERELAVQFLGLINTSADLPVLIASVADFFHKHGGCEAVGVRLKSGDDFPYYETRGFPREFVLAENSLWHHEADGRLKRDVSGNPLVACMCGAVIQGMADPANPSFTQGGSFWTNSTTQLLDAIPASDARTRICSRRNHDGYESVALIPLRAGGDRLGLLQLNDRRPGRFTTELIAFWERLGGYLAVAIAKSHAEEALRQLNESLEHRVAERTAETRQLAEQLRALAAELSQAEQRERKRMATILHDHIQQLLVAAKMQLELVKRANPATIRSTVQGIESIVTEAIDASRSLTVELSPPILHQAGLAAALAWLANRLEEKYLFKVHVRASQDDEPASEPVRLLLFESVRELLLNAVKHSGVREARVIMARTPAGWTQVIVEDQGAGFDPAVLKSRKGGGFGIFSIQQRLAYFGGRMDVESAPGHGTRIIILAPPTQLQAEAAASSAAVPAAGGHEARLPGQGGRRISVLLADDHQIVRQGLVSILRFESDMEVIGEAADGRVAVETARRLKPDVVVMDIGMPVMDGVEATRIIRSEMPQIKVIGLSMYIEPEVAAALQKAGASGYVTKGGPAADLIEAIRACFEENRRS